MAKSENGAGLMNRTLIHIAATLHYLEGLSQVEVARRMQMSTASVSRLLAKAREDGVVRFEVAPLDAAADDDQKLAEALGLKTARAIDTVRQPALSAAVGSLIKEAKLPKNPVITIGWGRAIQNVVSHGLPKIPDAIVVPTTGGMNQSQAHFQINEFARTAAEQIGGTAKLLYAPAQPGPDLYAQLIRDPQIAAIMDLWNRVDVSVTGIGNFPETSAESSLGFTADEAANVKGDIVRQYFDGDGAAIAWPGQETQIGIHRKQLSRVPLAIGVSIGKDKVDAIIGAARSGMINTLVTDIRTGQQVLDRIGYTGAHRET
ncbi:MAG: sugar-binding domain-containing protein [Paracoccaceae bacterium]